MVSALWLFRSLNAQIENALVSSRILQALVRVMDLWPPSCERTVQSLQRQFDAQAGADRPTADDPGEDIHQDRQVNERPIAEANIGDVSDPDLIGAYDIEFLDQILVTRERVA
jgi:hypothetical protein